MKNNVLDIPLIQKTIHTKHGKFIKEFGPVYEKVIADHELFSNLVMAKIYCIADILIKENVISEVLDVECSPYRKVKLIKKGNNSYIEITTNGIDVLFTGYTYLSLDTSSLLSNNNEIFNDVNDVDFDWKNFSVKLLDYIHSIIYTRKEAARVRMDSFIKEK